ncbi:MAG: hypothetical protein WCC36_19100 [Gammaproteobacteria bacterium]
MVSTDVLNDVLEVVEGNPHGGPSLVLFALAKTLSARNGQYLYLLNKLRDIDPQYRQLAYRLMELMVEGGNHGPVWDGAVERMEQAIRNAR